MGVSGRWRRVATEAEGEECGVGDDAGIAERHGDGRDEWAVLAEESEGSDGDSRSVVEEGEGEVRFDGSDG